MMKMRMASNTDGYPLRLVLLFGYAYSNGAGMILSGRNTNEESGPGFSVFSVFQAKGCFEGKKLQKLFIFICQ